MIACTARHSLYIHWNSESILLVLWKQRCVQTGHWTVHNATHLSSRSEDVRGTLPGQHRALLRCSLLRCSTCTKACKRVTCSGGPAAPSNLAFPNPSVTGLVLHPAKARETRQCIVVTSLQLLDLASQSVQLDDVCLQAVPLLLHELNCSCHRNSCPELTSF